MSRNLFRFFFGAHASYADAVDMRPDYLWCTVYCPEGTGYGDANRSMHEFLSSGVMDAKKAFEISPGAEGPFDLAQFKLIYNSGKRIELIDVPYGSPVCAQVSSGAEEVRRIAYFDGPYATVCVHARAVIAAFVAVNRDRERYIVERLLQLDDELTDERILVRFGTAHYRMAKLARMCGLKVQSRFKSGNLGLFGLCYHTVNCGKPIPPRLMAHYLMSGLLLAHWPGPRMWLDGNEQEHTLTVACQPFSETDVAELWDDVRTKPNHAVDILRSALERRTSLDS